MQISPLTWIVSALTVISASSVASAATVAFGTPSNVSNYTTPDSAAGTPIIYGGIAGNELDCLTKGPNTLCNNCVGTNACNERRIHSNLILRIPFTVTTDTAGYVFFGSMKTGAPVELTGYYTKSTTGTLSKDQTGYIEIAWGTLCDDAFGDPNCENGSATGNYFVAISPDNVISAEEATPIQIRIFAPSSNNLALINDIACSEGKNGVCSIAVGAGDEKAYIDEIERSGTYPTVENVPVKYLRIYYANAPGSDVRNIDYSSNYGRVDLNIDGSGAPSPNKVEGLNNEEYYGFKAAIVDEAYNVAFLTSNNQINLECTAFTLDINGYQNCPYITKPSKVVGLLPEDVNCFISTAAFGSTMASKVNDFRRFRNRVLMRSDAGVELVKAYYNYGPRASRVIHKYPILKPLARTALWPLWFYSTLSLKFGFGFTLLVYVLSSFVFGGLIIGGIFTCVRSKQIA